jgi:pyruvate/2-oxoglutarate dehydrogenase complex dihydrolipoamide dehydrogenase (E3) component
MERLFNYLKTQIEKLGVEVNWGRGIHPEEAARMKADGVVIACGTLPLIPTIRGLDSVQTIQANEALLGKHKVGQKVLIIGGGMAGCETADYFSDQGKEVIGIEILEKMVVNMVPVLRRTLLDRLKKKGVVMLVGVKGERIESRQMIGQDREGKEHRIKADTFILATGGIPRQGEWAGLKTTLGDKLFFVGDITGAQEILEAIAQGNRVGRII